ncbi:MAG: hypothetical protein E7430_09055 [Ruminococcaceae bacterium]|nr:hypothetical protein [Oscillospiraceae bacterium]
MYINFGNQYGSPSVLWYTEQKLSDGITCPLCGATANTIKKTGKAGCAKCYEVFASVLDPYIKRIHGSVTHNGRIPGGGTPEQKQEREISQLRQQLKSAVEAEDYLKAAELRDRIRELEGK